MADDDNKYKDSAFPSGRIQEEADFRNSHVSAITKALIHIVHFMDSPPCELSVQNGCLACKMRLNGSEMLKGMKFKADSIWEDIPEDSAAGEFKPDEILDSHLLPEFFDRLVELCDTNLYRLVTFFRSRTFKCTNEGCDAVIAAKATEEYCCRVKIGDTTEEIDWQALIEPTVPRTRGCQRCTPSEVDAADDSAAEDPDIENTEEENSEAIVQQQGKSQPEKEQNGVTKPSEGQQLETGNSEEVQQQGTGQPELPKSETKHSPDGQQADTPPVPPETEPPTELPEPAEGVEAGNSGDTSEVKKASSETSPPVPDQPPAQAPATEQLGEEKSAQEQSKTEESTGEKLPEEAPSKTSPIESKPAETPDEETEQPESQQGKETAATEQQGEENPEAKAEETPEAKAETEEATGAEQPEKAPSETSQVESEPSETQDEEKKQLRWRREKTEQSTEDDLHTKYLQTQQTETNRIQRAGRAFVIYLDKEEETETTGLLELPVTLNVGRDNKYNLCAVITRGNQNYYTLIKDSAGHWWKMGHSQTRRATDREVVDSGDKACLLFYETAVKFARRNLDLIIPADTDNKEKANDGQDGGEIQTESYADAINRPRQRSSSSSSQSHSTPGAVGVDPGAQSSTGNNDGGSSAVSQVQIGATIYRNLDLNEWNRFHDIAVSIIIVDIKLNNLLRRELAAFMYRILANRVLSTNMGFVAAGISIVKDYLAELPKENRDIIESDAFKTGLKKMENVHRANCPNDSLTSVWNEIRKQFKGCDSNHQKNFNQRDMRKEVDEVHINDQSRLGVIHGIFDGLLRSLKIRVKTLIEVLELHKVHQGQQGSPPSDFKGKTMKMLIARNETVHPKERETASSRSSRRSELLGRFDKFISSYNFRGNYPINKDKTKVDVSKPKVDSQEFSAVMDSYHQLIVECDKLHKAQTEMETHKEKCTDLKKNCLEELTTLKNKSAELRQQEVPLTDF